MRYLGFLFLVCLVSCKAQKESSASAESIENMVLLAHDNYSNVSEYQTLVIQDQKTLQKFYSQFNKTRKPGLPLPMIDFSKETLILVCLGEQQGEQSVTISKIEETDSKMVLGIDIVNNKAGNDGKSLSSPFYLYKMPLVGKAITFLN